MAWPIRKSKDVVNNTAMDVYAVLLDRVCEPVFYADYDVPDTLDGRFDLLTLHVFLVMNHLLSENHPQAQDFNQQLFDVMFANMDQTLRQRGIGDMGIPKHMRRMMLAFNGRVHTYSEVIEDECRLKEAVIRNIYAEKPVDDGKLVPFLVYIRGLRNALDSQASEEIIQGRISLCAVE